MTSVVFFHFWLEYTETLAIMAPLEHRQALADFLNTECTLSQPVGTPGTGSVESLGWFVGSNGVGSRYSGTDVEKVHNFLRERLGVTDKFNSCKSSIDRGPQFKIELPLEVLRAAQSL